eukprot:1092810-Lingulodinium_polyedra.AAC.1
MAPRGVVWGRAGAVAPRFEGDARRSSPRDCAGSHRLFRPIGSMISQLSWQVRRLSQRSSCPPGRPGL